MNNQYLRIIQEPNTEVNDCNPDIDPKIVKHL